MRALSLTQPWATLIAIGAKKVETRSWSTNHRGLIAIHAAKGFPKYAREFAEMEVALERLPSRLPLGAIIALARIVKVERTEEAKFNITTLERLYGDYSSGRYAWYLSGVIALPEPIPCKGALSLWEVPEEIKAKIITPDEQAEEMRPDSTGQMTLLM